MAWGAKGCSMQAGTKAAPSRSGPGPGLLGALMASPPWQPWHQGLWVVVPLLSGAGVLAGCAA